MSDEVVSERAASFVNLVVEDAIKKLSEEEETPKNVNWMTIEDFDVQLATAAIEQYVSTFALSDCWLHCTDYLGVEELEFESKFKFRVMFSVPTRRHPIPKATANVYFTIAVSHVKPKKTPVDVSFVVESNRLVHRPGEVIFREKWLQDVVESKAKLMRVIDF